MKRLALGFLCLLLMVGTARADAVLKIATLAPDGSFWMRAFKKWQKMVEEHSGNKIKIKFYPGGVSGDERDAVRKMRMGGLNGAAVTAIGLGLIQSEVRVLELPMFIRTYEELDYVRGKLDAEIRKKFEDKGYVFLAWGDVGPVHIFSKIPLKSRADLAQTKLWAWVDDPLVRALFEQLGTHGVPLGVPDVLPSLQTGLIDACYGSPLSTVALQWYTKEKYVTSMHISQAIGALVVTKRDFDKLSAEEKKVLVNDSKELEGQLLKEVHAENVKSLASLKQAGIQVVDSPPDMVKQFETESLALRSKLEPSVFTHEWRMRVEQLLKDFRAGKK